MDIDTLIETQELTWRDIIYEIVRGMDPWNIDIIELATRYSKKVEEMQEMNFRIPANVVLVSSVLLRMKADILSPREEDPYTNMAESLNFILDGNILESIYHEGNGDTELDFTLGIKPRRVPSRRVTADELISAIQAALEERGVRQRKKSNKDNGDITMVIVPEVNMEKFIDDIYSRVIKILSQKEVVLFSELAKTRDDVIHTFISLLHLSNRRKLNISQERMFDEIYIRQGHPD